MANNNFYRDKYNSLIYVLIGEIVILLLLVSFVLYQIFHRPLPVFIAATPKGQQMQLTASLEPNLLANTLLKWASNAAVAAYTYNFDANEYKQQLALIRPYFTDAGWQSYQSSIRGLINTIFQNQLAVNSVVSGTPVISNQGEFPGHGYTWRIQIPFLVTYLSSEQTRREAYTVTLTIVKVPTYINPAGIGIDQFIMS